jgi:hypothetical protein
VAPVKAAQFQAQRQLSPSDFKKKVLINIVFVRFSESLGYMVKTSQRHAARKNVNVGQKTRNQK